MRGITITFDEKYSELEDKFRGRVKCDNKEFEVGSSYLPNFVPRGPVDFVLIAMEPSEGTRGKILGSVAHPIRNFLWSVEDFILHHCVRKYLCQSGETYHLTDLSKGAMTTKLAGIRRRQRYKRWYPLLQEELRLLTKPEGTRIIAIGNVVAEFLQGRGLCECVEKVLHYSPAATGHREKVIAPWIQEFPEFSDSIDCKTLKETVKDVLKDAALECYYQEMPSVAKPLNLTESRKKLMFHYKKRFGELRISSSIVLKHGSN